ncbi:MAG: TonB family protein [bacterium]
MNTLGNKDKQNNLSEEEKFRLPKTYTNEDNGIPIWLGVLIGIVIHIILPIVISLILFLLAFLGLNLFEFKPPETKTRDIEFVLVNKQEQTPINKRTKNRSDRNSRAAGKHDKRKPVAEAEAQTKRSKAQSASSSAPKHRVVAKQRQQQQNIFKRLFEPTQPKRSVDISPPRPKRPVPDATFRNELAPPRPHSLSIPSGPPKARSIKSHSYKGGPVTTGPMGVSGSSSSPNPIMGNGGNGTSRYKGGNPSSYAPGNRGSVGNPDAGGLANGSGIDSARDVDFGPYMRALQSRIKRNWSPPRDDASKRVVMFFKIAKDGRLISHKIVRGSGSPEADRAAMSAVELSAPFRPLPPAYRENDIDIQFTFDYNAFGGIRR